MTVNPMDIYNDIVSRVLSKAPEGFSFSFARPRRAERPKLTSLTETLAVQSYSYETAVPESLR